MRVLSIPYAAAPPTINDVLACRDRLLEVGGMLQTNTQTFVDDFYPDVIDRAATLKVIGSVCYWKARETPRLEGLSRGGQPHRPSDDNNPF